MDDCEQCTDGEGAAGCLAGGLCLLALVAAVFVTACVATRRGLDALDRAEPAIAAGEVADADDR